MYTIGKLSKKTGVTIRTLDYYDEIGLLNPSSTTEGGHRLYGEAELLRLEQILSLKFFRFFTGKITTYFTRTCIFLGEKLLEEQLLMVKEQRTL